MTRPASLILTAALSLGAGGGTGAQAQSLTLSVDTAGATGTLRAAVYDSQAAFDARRAVAAAAGPAGGDPAQLRVPGLAPGIYGVAVFLDKNDNGELDRNLLGAPTEPYGFSTNPTLGRAAPRFDDFRFTHDGRDRQLAIALHGG